MSNAEEQLDLILARLEKAEETNANASSSETSTTKLKNLTLGQIAMKDRICVKCKGGGHLASHCPTKTLITFEDHHALLGIMIEEEAEKQRALQKQIEQEKEMAQDSRNLYISTYESKGLSKKERKALKRERFLNIH
ncbi:DNA topoisomerase 3-alpha [Bienertia sinuspersici]